MCASALSFSTGFPQKCGLRNSFASPADICDYTLGIGFIRPYFPVNSSAIFVIASHASVRNGAAGSPAALNKLQPMG